MFLSYLKNLGFESTALGFTAGFVGQEISRKLDGQGINARFIQLEQGCSRINIKLKESDGTEINGKGPEISPPGGCSSSWNYWTG